MWKIPFDKTPASQKTPCITHELIDALDHGIQHSILLNETWKYDSRLYISGKILNRRHPYLGFINIINLMIMSPLLLDY